MFLGRIKMGNKTKISGVIEMSKTHGGKGDRPRPIDRKAWDNSKLWENLKNGKSEKEQGDE